MPAVSSARRLWPASGVHLFERPTGSRFGPGLHARRYSAPMDRAIERRLVRAAREVRANAHVPVSGIHVGAALLGVSGRIYAGCNVESSVLQTICAERTALGQAISRGEHAFTAVAVVTEFDPPWAPCGICRQVLSDFGLDLEVVMAGPTGPVRRRTTIGELLPMTVQDTDLLAAAQREGREARAARRGT
jgi:cytidine deaminase